MYEAFYDLNERPFSILPDPYYLYFGKRHKLAYAMLEYGVEYRAGFTVITGEVGCGKTTLIRHLLNNLEQDVTVGLISNTHKDIGELLKWVLLSFNQPYDSTDKVALFDRLQRFLIDEYSHNRRAVLIIDEAQNLTPHEIKTIITRAGEGTKIVLTGDPYQIDNPYIDSASNGLTYVVEKFKNEDIAGHVTLDKGERSCLAELAANLL